MSDLKEYSSKHIKAFSFFCIPFLNPITWLMVGRKRLLLSPEDIDPNKHYVFAVSHTGAADFMVVFYSLPFSIHRKLAPYRFFVANRFFKNPLIRWPVMSWGGFPASKHSKYKYGIDAAEHGMTRNETIVIFPEGKVSPIDRKYRPKRGVEVLAKMSDVMLIPVRAKWQRKKGVFKSYSLVFGKPFDGSLMTADQIMDKVYALSFKD